MTLDTITWPTRLGDTVEVYVSIVGSIDELTATAEWRYRVRARNNKIVEQGSEGYTRKAAAIKAAARHHPRVEVAS